MLSNVTLNSASSRATIPAPSLQVRSGGRQSGFMVQAEMEGHFPVEPSVMFQLLTHKENIFSGVVDAARKPAEVAPAVANHNDPRFKVYEVVVVTKGGQKPSSLRMLVEEDARDPNVMTRRSNLLQADQLERMEARWTVLPAEGSGCTVRLEQGLTPKGVPALIRPAVVGFVRSATEKGMRQNHEDLAATVQQVLAGASVDDAAAAMRAQHSRRSKQG